MPKPPAKKSPWAVSSTESSPPLSAPTPDTQTADEQIFPACTAFLCDAGMCGPVESVLGREIEAILRRFLTSRPVVYPIAKGPVVLHGAMIDIDETNGRALHIERVAHRVEFRD